MSREQDKAVGPTASDQRFIVSNSMQSIAGLEMNSEVNAHLFRVSVGLEGWVTGLGEEAIRAAQQGEGS
jgi:hypothetical protein